MRYILAAFAAAAVLFMGSMAFGAVPDPGADPGGFFSAVVGACSGRNWLMLVGLFVLLATWLLRREGSWLVGKVPWLGSRWGGYLMAFLLAALPLVSSGLIEHKAALDVGREVLVVVCGAIAAWGAVKDVARA